MFRYSILICCNLRVVVSMRASPLPPSFLVTLTSSLVRNALCMVIFSCSLVHLFKFFSWQIYDSSLSSHPSFDFLSVIFKGTSIFSKTNFAPAYIKLFNLVMSFDGVLVNKSFTFSASDLTVLQSLFLIEGNLVFFSDMILLMVSILFFSSWVSVCVYVFAVQGSLSCIVCLEVSDFCVFSISVTVLGVCWCVCQYITWWISSISRSEN